MTDRTKFLGSSDAPVVVGLSKWKSPVQLWLEKTGFGQDQPDNIVLELGRFLEPFVLGKFAERYGEIHSKQAEIVDPKRPWRMAHIDAAFGCNIVEAKTAGMVFLSSNHGWGEELTDEVPDQYLVQAQHQMSLKEDAMVVWMPVLLRGSFKVYRIERNQPLIDAIVEKEERFWDMVESRIMPPPVSTQDLKAIYPDSTEEAIEATPEVIEALKTLRTLKGYKKSQDEIEEQAKLTVFAHMQGKSVLVDMEGNKLATWKTQKKKAYVVKDSKSRVFRLTGMEEK